MNQLLLKQLNIIIAVLVCIGIGFMLGAWWVGQTLVCPLA